MLKYWIWLAGLPGLTNQDRLEILRHFETPEKAYYADAGDVLLTEDGCGIGLGPLADKDLSGPEGILADCSRLGLRILTVRDVEYPERLRNIYDPPLLLYVRGRLPQVDEEAVVAVVGTRNCTPYGRACGERFGYGLARGGAVVVSGLARGVDTAAARGALRGGGAVIGVLGCGVDVVYPRENGYLYEDVAAAGALVSEYPPGTRPARGHFPARNRIMAGLSLGTLVVEAPLGSGALITGDLALDSGRDLFAVPGPIDAPASAGSNRLLREGGLIALEPGDIIGHYAGQFPGKLRQERSQASPEAAATPPRRPPLEAPRPVPPAPRLPEEGALPAEQMDVLRLLAKGPMTADDLMMTSGIAPHKILTLLTLLKLGGYVDRTGERWSVRSREDGQ